AAAISGAAAWLLRPAAPEPPLRRLEIPVTGIDRSFVSGRTVEISPDGTRVAWAIGNQIRIRPLDTLEPREVQAAGNVAYIFWSPDSAWLAFSAGARLWKVAADGGEPVAIADQDAGLQGGSGATWSPDGSIIMASGEGGLSSVPSQGGDVTSFLKQDPDKESDIHQPEALPDGSGVLFVPHQRSGRPDSLVLLSKGQKKELFRIEGQTIWDPVYSPTGHILFRREPKNPGIWALPFSLKTHEVTGDPFLVVQDGTMPSVSEDGTLVYVRGYGSRKCRLAIIDRDGKETARLGGEEEYWPFPTLSPDGTKVAVSIKLDGADDIWIYDIQRETKTRLTFGARLAGEPFWSRDGQWIYYHEGQAGPPFNMFRKRVDGSGTPEPLGQGFRPTVTADGRDLVFVEESEKSKDTTYDIYYQDLQKKGEPVQLAKDPGIQYAARVSPDGTLVAYSSTESGAPEVFIRKFPAGDGKWQVSVGGGGWARWSRAGDRIYYARGTGIYEVAITRPNGGMQLSAPKLDFTTKGTGIPIPNGWDPGYDISPDGRTAVVMEPSAETRPSSNIIVVENWISQFRGQH
ncbi:MAG TPA: hypothetical protein VNI57_10170, partial [Candidatus Saccharimonadales bacterium]|nr:hypothetical protein [Candidatus Saccharimonadales bacterium]